jgi:hypothetical protein
MFAIPSLVLATQLFAQMPEFSLRPELRIGAADGNGSFTSITSIAVDSRGRIYVSDGMEKNVKVFNAAGKFIRTIGRPGSGPGDLQAPGQIGIVADTLWVSELMGRVTFFDISNGRMIRVLTLPPGYTRSTGYSSGRGLTHLFEFDRLANATPPLVFAGAPRSMNLDTLLSIPRRNSSFVLNNQGHAVYRSTQPFSDDPVAAISPDGATAVVVTFPPPASSGTASFVVTTYVLPTKPGASPHIKARRNVPYRAQPLTDRIVDDWVQRMSERNQAPMLPKNRADAFRKALYRPKWLRPVSLVRVHRDGSIWLAHRTSNDRAQWTIMNPDLTPRGKLTHSQERGYLLDSNLDRVWLVEHDELDIPYLIGARLQPARR